MEKIKKIKCNCRICEKAEEGELQKTKYIDLLRHTEKHQVKLTIKIQQKNTRLYILSKNQEIYIKQNDREPKNIKKLWGNESLDVAKKLIKNSKTKIEEKPKMEAK